MSEAPRTGESAVVEQGRELLPLARHTQRFTTERDEDGNVGDCLRAAFASLFGLDVDEVPHFARYGIDDPKGTVDRDGWWYAMVGFADRLTPSYATVTADEPPEPSESQDDLYGCYMASGKSPRGDWQHVVVARGGEVIWDPHPSRAGVDGPLTYDCHFVCRTVLSGRSGGGS